MSLDAEKNSEEKKLLEDKKEVEKMQQFLKKEKEAQQRSKTLMKIHRIAKRYNKVPKQLRDDLNKE